ncbi:unnamed protein product [Cuscuta epithymum]|uniref:Uncharacterized protein n=1 Tax=Cuscuta epithymum TaxID=186058 RepID=A0AAV0DFR5_9ASTE|nr:unnamed protein product [Cuscuta epithymum]
MVETKGLFRLQTKKENKYYKGVPTFSVIRMNCDPTVIALYKYKGKAVEEEDDAVEEEDDFTLLRKEFSVSEEVLIPDEEETSPLLSKEKRKELVVNYDGIKRKLFVEPPPVKPPKKLKKVKMEKE